MGEPNKSLSNGTTLRFGDHGRIAVGISGERMGSWYDFSRDKGGDMFCLVQDKLGYDFKGAAEYLSRSVGIKVGNNNHLQLVDDHRNKDLTKDYIKDQMAEERINKAKAAQVAKLYSRAKNIDNQSPAFRYLTEHRGLELNSVIGSDVKTANVYVSNESTEESTIGQKGKYLPAIIAFARDASGNITGGQQIVLNKSNGSKADIAIPKKSFGRIAGSLVDVGQVHFIDDRVANSTLKLEKEIEIELEKAIETEKITIIAEGLETALSIKQGVSEHKYRQMQAQIFCSLGISNIKNYQPKSGEKIIIAADNDGLNSVTNKTIENAKIALEEKGAFVTIVRPEKEGDFNDVLKSDGTKAITQVFKTPLLNFSSNNLKEYMAIEPKTISFDEQDKSNLAYIEKYDLPQKSIVDAYRKSDLSGKIELDQSRKMLEVAATNFKQNEETIQEARKLGYEGTESLVTKQLIGMNEDKAKEHCIAIVGNVIKENIDTKQQAFQKEKELADKPQDVLAILFQENEFLAQHQNKLKYLRPEDKVFKAIEVAAKEIRTGHEMEKITNALKFAQKNKINSTEVIGVLKKHGEDLPGVKHSLVSLCVDHNVIKIQHNLDTIKSKGFIHFDKVRFDNQVKYLEHLTSSQHEFLPRSRIDKALGTFKAKQKELSKDMGGISM